MTFDDFFPAALETATYQDKLYALPFQVEAHALVYNKGAFREAGLDPEKPPQTWDELVVAAQTLTKTTERGQQYGYGVAGGGQDQPGNTLFRTLPLMWMNGGGILSDDFTKVTLNQPESVAAVQFYADFYTKHAVAPPSTLENDGLALRRLFIAESIAMIQASQADFLLIKQGNPDLNLGVARLPHPKDRDPAVILGGWNFIVPAEAPNKAETLQFLQFLSSTENIAYYTNTSPARRSGFDQPQHQRPDLVGFKQMLDYARRQPPLPEWSQIVQIYYDHFQEVLLGTPAQEAMDAAAAEIQPLLEQ
jgi:ABC-type glycerol-3-phosphate transport system substrate-binding protein